jgi:hypothetical protein
MRPGEDDWRRLRSIGDLGNYLQVAQKSTLNNWVVGLSANTPVHDIELMLRQRFRAYIDELSRWPADEWHASIVWVKRLIDLPALAHILSGQSASNWMLDDPEIKPFIHVNTALRDEAFMASDCKVFLEAWKRNESLSDAWFREWCLLSPLKGKHVASLDRIWRPFASRLKAQCEAPEESTERSRESLERELRGAFRKMARSPENIFVHLGLIALDLEKLRGDLVYRSLFQASPGATA